MNRRTTPVKFKWIPITTGDSDVHFKFNKEPKKPKGLKFYYFHYTYKHPRTQKYEKGKITTGESDFRRALDRRDELKELVEYRLFSAEVQYSDKQPIGEFFESYLEAKEQERKKWNTTYDYRLKIAAFVKFADENLPLCNVDSNILRRFFAQIKSESVRALTYRILRAAFNFAVMEEKLEKNPMHKVKLHKGSKPIREWLTEKEFIRIYERMPEKTYIDRTAKNAALFAFAIGPRIGEVCNVLLKSINWERKEIAFVKTKVFDLKNSCERSVPMSPRLEEAVINQIRNKAQHSKDIVRESPYLFTNEAGKPYVISEKKGCKLSKCFKKICVEVYPDRPHIHFHSLRHSFIQIAVNSGMSEIEIAKITGHNDLNSLRSYVRIGDYKSAKMNEYLLNQSVISNPNPISNYLPLDDIEICVQSDMIT